MKHVMNLVLIETSGNQAFIFATNKLRENVGASELTARVGRQWVLEAVASPAVGGPDLRADTLEETREKLLDAARNRPVDDANPVEVILAVSGKALLLVRDAALGRQIVREVTLRALREAPGLAVHGVVSRDFDFHQNSLHSMVREVHQQLEAIRSRLPSPATRFQRLPIIAECATSGLPAARYDATAPEPTIRSAEVLAKRKAAEPGLQRIRRLVGDQPALPDSTTEMESLGVDWLAIVHADGNGLEQVMLNFDKGAARDNRDYVQKLRAFSLALEACTERAFRRSLTVLRRVGKGQLLPVVPLVLGGDDLTMVCDGRQALPFTKKFLDCLEEETKNDRAIQEVLPRGLTSCAGVAIVKPHFPFFVGYELAAALLQSAKTIAKEDPADPASAIDFHILYDASAPDLERIRRDLTVDEGQTLLVGRPYVTTTERGRVGRRWSDLYCRVAAVRAKDEDQRRRLPSSILHELREGLFLGHQAADARLKLVLERYRSEGLDRLLGTTAGGGSLFWQDSDDRRTALMDAIDAAEFWGVQ